MKQNLKISIIMNCLNGEKYLSQAITSVLNQSYENWELIFWNNKSEDKSEKMEYIDEKHQLKETDSNEEEFRKWKGLEEDWEDFNKKDDNGK